MILVFVIGAILGATVGVAIMACLSIAQFEKMKEDDDK